VSDDTFSAPELEYLGSQRLGRLATVDPTGTPQNNPVGFTVADDGTVRIRGRNLAGSRKFRNVRRHGRVSFVVDDIASLEPWQVRGVEIRGAAEALTGVEGGPRWAGGEEIRIHPERIVSWGLDRPVP
jgi:pyridoxamine 5'-phosphate oxidase family protein